MARVLTQNLLGELLNQRAKQAPGEPLDHRLAQNLSVMAQVQPSNPQGFNATPYTPEGSTYIKPLYQRQEADYTKALQRFTAPDRVSGVEAPGQVQPNQLQGYRQGLASALQQTPTTYTPGGDKSGTVGSGVPDWQTPVELPTKGQLPGGENDAPGDQGDMAVDADTDPGMSVGDWMGTYGWGLAKGFATMNPVGISIALADAVATTMNKGVKTTVKEQTIKAIKEALALNTTPSLLGEMSRNMGMDTFGQVGNIGLSDQGFGYGGTQGGGFGFGGLGIGMGTGTVGGIGPGFGDAVAASVGDFGIGPGFGDADSDPDGAGSSGGGSSGGGSGSSGGGTGAGSGGGGAAAGSGGGADGSGGG